MDADELFRAGKLKEAVASVTEHVRGHPTDADRRWMLVELLCLEGKLERADTQLELIADQAPDARPGVSLFRQLVRAEQARRQFHSDGRVPEFLGLPGERLAKRLRAAVALREKDAKLAAQLAAEADEMRPSLRGTCDGKPFDELRDLDDMTADFFEVLTSTGKYYWIPFERVASVEFHAPSRPRDLLWRRATMSVREGPDGEVYLPAIYPGTDSVADDGARLGRSTDWVGGDGEPTRGVGQRTLLVGEEARPILEIESIATEAAGS
jgi:type VI secretion system protein ImpE